jgi:hypothetical protein
MVHPAEPYTTAHRQSLMDYALAPKSRQINIYVRQPPYQHTRMKVDINPAAQLCWLLPNTGTEDNLVPSKHLAKQPANLTRLANGFTPATVCAAPARTCTVMPNSKTACWRPPLVVLSSYDELLLTRQSPTNYVCLKSCCYTSMHMPPPITSLSVLGLALLLPSSLLHHHPCCCLLS